MAHITKHGQGRATTLPTFSPQQSRLDRMREYSALLTARNAQAKPPGTALSTTESISQRFGQLAIPKLQSKKTAKSMTADINCSPCNRDDFFHEAAGYCIECSEYFCETCIKHHRNLKITKNHTMQDRRKMPKVQNYIPDEETIEICTLHAEELVRYYCKDHDEPTCGICATLDHRACNDVIYIPDLKSKETNKSCIMTLKHVNSLASQFEKAASETDKNLQILGKMQGDYKQALLKLHHEVIDKLQHLERGAVQNMEYLGNSEHGYLATRADTCHNAVKTLQQASIQLEAAKKNSIDSKVFLYMRKTAKQIVYYEELLADIQKKNTCCLQFKFKVDKRVKEFMGTADAVGTLAVSQRPQRTVKPLTQLKVNLRSDINDTCDITGVCVMEDGRIVLADMSNESLKVVCNNQLVTQSKLSSEPFDVCPVSKDQVIISLPREKKLQFLTISSTIHPLKKIGHVASLITSQYFGVAHFQGNLYVTCPNDEPPCVKILDMQGSQLQQITTEDEQQSLFNNPLYLALSIDGRRIYISDSGNNSIVDIKLKKDGSESTVHEIPEENVPGGLCVQPEGDIYCCGLKSNSVLHLTADEEFREDFIDSEIGLQQPQAISYCPNNRQLIVTMQKSNIVKVFQLF